MESRISIAYLRARPAPLPSPINAYVSAHNLNSFAAILYCEQKEKKWVAENMVRLERSLLKGNRWETRAPNIKAAGLLLTTQNQSWFQEQRVIFPLDTCNLLSNHLSRPGHLLCVVTFVPSWPFHTLSKSPGSIGSPLIWENFKAVTIICVSCLYQMSISNKAIFLGVAMFWLLTSSPGSSTFTTVTFISACTICLSSNCAMSSIVSFLDKHIAVGHLVREKGSWPAKKRGGGKNNITMQCKEDRAQELGESEREGEKNVSKRCMHAWMYVWHDEFVNCDIFHDHINFAALSKTKTDNIYPVFPFRYPAMRSKGKHARKSQS